MARAESENPGFSLDSLYALRLVIVAAVYIFAVLQPEVDSDLPVLAVVAARWRLVSTEHNNV